MTAVELPMSNSDWALACLALRTYARNRFNDHEPETSLERAAMDLSYRISDAFHAVGNPLVDPLVCEAGGRH